MQEPHFQSSIVPFPVPESMNSVDFAERTRMDHFHRLDIARIKETLLSGEENFSGAAMLLIYMVTLFHRITD